MFFIKLTSLLIFFYDILPIQMNVYTISVKENYQFCPLYFSLDFNTTNCLGNWFKLNDTFNGHKIQCIGRSPYILKDNNFIYSCLPDYLDEICNGIENLF